MNISLINIPPERPEQIVTEFLESYADIEGKPMDVQKTHNSKTYCTGTRVYQINKLYQHIPRRLPNMLGRTIICIYHIQPEEQEYYERERKQRQQNNRTQYQQSPDNSDNTNTDSDEDTDNTWKQQGYYRKKQNQQKRKQNKKNFNNVTQRQNIYTHQRNQQPPEKNEQNYPQLQPQQNQDPVTTTQTEKTPKTTTDNMTEDTHIIPETNPPPEPTIIPETYLVPTTQPDEIFDSPSLVKNNKEKLIQDTPEPNNVPTPESSPTDKEDNNRKSTPKTKKELKDTYKTFKAKKFTTQLQQTSFCDIGKLTKATKQERDTIIAISMYDRLGLHDPSKEYTGCSKSLGYI